MAFDRGEIGRMYREGKQSRYPDPFDCADVCRSIVPFCGDTSFVFVAGVNKIFRDTWKNDKIDTETAMCGPHTTPFQLRVSFAHLGLTPSTYICREAARLGKIRCLVVAIDYGCKIDRSVAEAAARGGSIRVLAWLLHKELIFDHERVCTAAAEGGSIIALRWCRINGVVWTNLACLSAAQHGWLDVLVYLVSQECNLIGEELPVHQAAASGGHLHIMRFLSSNQVVNFKWDAQEALERSLVKSCNNVHDKAAFLIDALVICEGARIPVHRVESLLLLGPDYFDTILLANFDRVVGYPNPVLPTDVWDQHILIKAAISTGSLRMVDWVVDKGFPFDDDDILSEALKGGRMDLLEALIHRGCEWTDASSREGFRTAASENRVADLLACTKQAGGCKIFGNGRGNDLCQEAARGGAVEALDFALENSTGEKDTCICVCAVLTGRLDVIRVAVGGGAPISSQCVLAAITEGHEKILEYLLEMSCPIDFDPFVLAIKAAKLRRPDIRDALVSRNIVSVYEMAVAGGSIDAIERVLCTCDHISDEALRGAATMADPEPLKLLYTKVDADRWRREYEGLLANAEWGGNVETSAWIESTRAW